MVNVGLAHYLEIRDTPLKRMEPQNHPFLDLHDCGFKLVIFQGVPCRAHTIFVPNFSAASTHSVVVSLEVATLEPTVLHVSPKKSQFHWTTNEVQKRTLIDPHPKCKKRIKSCKSCFMAKIQFSYIIASLVNLHSNSASSGGGARCPLYYPGQSSPPLRGFGLGHQLQPDPKKQPNDHSLRPWWTEVWMGKLKTHPPKRKKI